MKPGAPSRTAQWVAAARHMGMMLPQDVRLAEDPYGALFSSPRAARLLARAPRLATLPGLGTWVIYMQVRTRVIDDEVRAFVARGGRQLVVLGAGYDCRALRMPELADAAVYEVDHPTTQQHKRDVLARRDITSPVHYLAWDFETRPLDDLPDALASAGLDPRAAVLTIWEGVTMYLTEAAIDASLRAIRAWSGPGAGETGGAGVGVVGEGRPWRPGSELVMTYFARDRLEHPSLPTRAVQAAVARLGEPFRFGWEHDQLPAYLHDRGFELTSDVTTVDAAHALLPADLAGLVRKADSRIATARVI